MPMKATHCRRYRRCAIEGQHGDLNRAQLFLVDGFACEMLRRSLERKGLLVAGALSEGLEKLCTVRCMQE